MSEAIPTSQLLETLKAFRLDCLTDMEGADADEFIEAESGFNAGQYIAERLGIWPQLQAVEGPITVVCQLCGDHGMVHDPTGTANSEGGEDFRTIDCPNCK